MAPWGGSLSDYNGLALRPNDLQEPDASTVSGGSPGASGNGFADDLRIVRVFNDIADVTLVSAKVYILGREAVSASVRLVTTFYTYLQLTP
jgi:hypothetical protein